MLRQSRMVIDDVRDDVVSGREEQNLLPEIDFLARALTNRASGVNRCEERFAPRASGRHLAAIWLQHEVARISDLAVAKSVDHLLGTGCDQIMLAQPAFELLNERRVVSTKGRVKHVLNSGIEVRLPTGPTVRS